MRPMTPRQLALIAFVLYALVASGSADDVLNLEYPTNEVQPMHVEWMRQDMAHRTAGTFVVTTAEADLTRYCPGFLEMARQNDVRLQLVGDDHIVAYKARAVPYRTGGALSGCWWTPAARELCPDLSPQGYQIYRVAEETMECFYKGLGQRVAIVSHRVAAPWKGRVKVQAHLVQPQCGETLEYSLNGTDWKPMEECDRPFYRARYEAVVDSTSVSDGQLNFRVRSTASGEVCMRTFVIANGSGSAAFKVDALLTITVSPATDWTTCSAWRWHESQQPGSHDSRKAVPGSEGRGPSTGEDRALGGHGCRLGRFHRRRCGTAGRNPIPSPARRLLFCLARSGVNPIDA